MAMAKKCDICGNYYTPKSGEINGFSFEKMHYDGPGVLCTASTEDACPECIGKIKNFINEMREKK